MIVQNLGKIERLIRLTIAAALLFWVVRSPSIGPAQLAAVLAALALIWNAIYGRCYLWKWLGLDTSETTVGCSKTPMEGDSAGTS